MRRKVARPYGQPIAGIRLVSMLTGLVVLWMLYNRLKDPATWRAIADDKSARPTAQVEAAKADKASPSEPEKIVLGPNDEDKDEVAAVQDMFEVITDRAALKPREMNAYWKLIDWSLTQPFDQLEKRALDDVPFTKLWEQPEKYRGKLIRLKMHVRRVLEFDAPENDSDLPKVYEAWGWTEESRSFPYVVVFPELPEGLPKGTDIRAEIVFVGYFLKVMTYAAFDHSRGAPLLLGRAQFVSKPVATAPAQADPWIIPLALIGATSFIGFSIWTGMRARGKAKAKMLPSDLSEMGPLDSFNFDNTFSQIDAKQPTSNFVLPTATFAATTETPPLSSSEVTSTTPPAEVEASTPSPDALVDAVQKLSLPPTAPTLTVPDPDPLSVTVEQRPS